MKITMLCPLCRIEIATSGKGILRPHHNRENKPCPASGTNVFHPEEAREKVLARRTKEQQ